MRDRRALDRWYRPVGMSATQQRAVHALVRLVVLLLVLYVAPVPTLFVLGWVYFGNGLLKAMRGRGADQSGPAREAA